MRPNGTRMGSNGRLKTPKSMLASGEISEKDVGYKQVTLGGKPVDIMVLKSAMGDRKDFSDKPKAGSLESPKEKIARLASFDFRTATQASVEKHQKELKLLTAAEKKIYFDNRQSARNLEAKKRRSKSAKKAAATRAKSKEAENARVSALKTTKLGQEVLAAEKAVEKQRKTGIIKPESLATLRKKEYQYSLDRAANAPTAKQKEVNDKSPELDLVNGKRAKSAFRGQDMKDYERKMNKNAIKEFGKPQVWGEPMLSTKINSVPWKMKTPNGDNVIFGAQVMPKSGSTKEVRVYTTPNSSSTAPYLRITFKAPKGAMNPGSEAQKIAERFVYAVGKGKAQNVDFFKMSDNLQQYIESTSY